MEEEKMTFDKCLWNKYESLHKRYKLKCEYFENSMEIFNRILAALKNDQKVISGIISKNYTLFPDAESTQSNALNFIKKMLENEVAQLALTIDLLKKTLTEIQMNLLKK